VHRQHNRHWYRLLKYIVVYFISLGLVLACEAKIPYKAQNIIFPDDAGIIDVTKSPYNAYGDGIHDDTTAIQQAFDDYINDNRIIYLPNGVYLVSDTIKWGPSTDLNANQQKRTILQGQSTRGVTVRLKDNSSGFEEVTIRDDGTKRCKGVIWTGKAPAQRFRNAVRNITIDTGNGNRGACGLQFIANNQGTVRDVRIISGDGQGLYGFDLAYTGEIGPEYIKNLYVEGFDYAIYGHYGNSATFENIEVKNQNISGIRHDSSIFIKDLKSFQSKAGVQALRNESKAGNVTLINAELKGKDPSISAIYNKGGLYGRNIVSSGYLKAIENTEDSQISIEDSNMEEFVSHETLKLFQSPNTSLHLPIEETPKVPWEQDMLKWANPLHYGADADESNSDSEAIQAAIDDPTKTVVYFPAGIKFRIDGDIYIRGNIKRIIGTEHGFSKKGVNGRFIFEDGTADTVVFERVMAAYTDVELVHNASRNLVISSCQSLPIVANGSGKLFIEDHVGNQKYNNPNMKVFGRSLNTEPWEADSTGIENNGAKIWIFGYKTEGRGTQISTSNGGYTELLGGFVYSTTKTPGPQIFAVDEANISLAGLSQSVTQGDKGYQNFVKQTRSGETKYLSESYSYKIPLYTGYKQQIALN
jgi:hypothetical protein